MIELVATCFPTPYGWCGIVRGTAGLQRIYLPEPDRDAMLDRMAGHYPGMRCEENCCKDVVRQLQRYFNGRTPWFDCRLDFSRATVFQKKVWRATRAIACGQVRTYGWLARKIGSPRAMRAVGAALGGNPFPIIIPCHRVIRQDGGMGGFSAVGGVGLKRELLRLEGALLLPTGKSR